MANHSEDVLEPAPPPTSAAKGVSWHVRNRKWRARFSVQGKQTCVAAQRGR